MSRSAGARIPDTRQDGKAPSASETPRCPAIVPSDLREVIYTTISELIGELVLRSSLLVV